MTGGDAGACPTDAGGVQCSGEVALHCDSTGHVTSSMACTGATPVCVAGSGCRACQPNMGRCDPTSASTPQTCAADGSGWHSGAACTAAGQTCDMGMCVDPCGAAALARSYVGCDYWPVTMQNLCVGEIATAGVFPTLPFAIAIANPQTAVVNVLIEGASLTASMNVSIPAGQLSVVNLPYVPNIAQLRARPGTSVLQTSGAYHVHSTAPVTVYQFNPLTFQDETNASCASSPTPACYSYSNDASLLLPTSVLGNHYSALTWTGMTYRIGATMPFDAGGNIDVVGTVDGTTVTVNLTAHTVAGVGVAAGAPGDTQTYQLGHGDVLHLLSGGDGNDLSGTTIAATQPVAVFTGHSCAQVPTDRLAGNHLEEQLFPDNVWGRRYAVTNFIDRMSTPSVVRIMALQDNTQLAFDPPSAAPPTTTLMAHRWVEFQAMGNFVVTGTQPILVAQFMYGEGTDTDQGDPAMVYEVPVEQYRTQYTFLTPETFTHSFVNIVGSTGTPPTLDGMPVAASAAPIGGSGLSVWALEVMPGVHTLGVTGSGTPYGVKVYGTALYTAYAYPAGLDLTVITPG